MTALLLSLATFGYGILSALVPIANAEVYVAGLAAKSDGMALAGYLTAMVAGTTVGKLVIFTAARHGSRRFGVGRILDRQTTPDADQRRRPFARVSALLLRWTSHRVLGPVTVLIAASVGIPPLLLVAAVCGVSHQNRALFAIAVFVGRWIRFGAIAFPVATLAH